VSPEESRRRFASEPVAHLATADGAARPHLVPFVFAVEASDDPARGDRIYTAVDHKPKRTTALRRLANIAENPAVAALVDHYEDDWERLWWVRADGSGRLVEPGSAEERHAVLLLQARYRPYWTTPPVGPVLAIEVERWSGWAAAEAAAVDD
jgi:PPOX class probable F420-dependent enzyme